MVHRQNDHGQLLVEADAMVLFAVGACRFAVGAHNAHVCEGVLGYVLTLNGGVLGSLSANLDGRLGGSFFRRVEGRVNQAQVLMQGVQAARLTHGYLRQLHTVAETLVPAVEPLAGHNRGHVANAQHRTLEHGDGQSLRGLDHRQLLGMQVHAGGGLGGRFAFYLVGSVFGRAELGVDCGEGRVVDGLRFGGACSGGCG